MAVGRERELAVHERVKNRLMVVQTYLIARDGFIKSEKHRIFILTSEIQIRLNKAFKLNKRFLDLKTAIKRLCNIGSSHDSLLHQR